VSILSVSFVGVSAGTTRTYDFKDTTFNKAYAGSDPSQPPPNLEIGTEFASGDYNAIAFLEGNLCSLPPNGNDSDYQRFSFEIPDSIDLITKIYLEHDGYGYGVVDNTPGVRLFIWNYDTSTWQFLAGHDVNDTVTSANATISSDFSSYINASGYLNLLAQAKENGGSCPFLYTQSSNGYVFVADLYGAGILAVPYYKLLSDDFAKIGGDQMVPKDGQYSVKLAQEYDEISYLDEVSLLTIDHSPQVDAFPSLLGTEIGKIYTVSKSLGSPVSAVDKTGNDVLRQIIDEDGVYTPGAPYSLNLLELNLGDLSGAQQIKLVLSAYSSWNVKEPPYNPEVPNPYARFVQVKDENGDWATVFENEDLQIPAALPRTYVLNLTGKFVNGYSVRIGFYPDVRIDYVGIDTSPQQEVIVNTLNPVYADLHFRGYSRTEGFPPTPDYYQLSPNTPPGYSDPSGNFTRFGDVLPLLTAKDDMYVIMHHGDEVSVKFIYLPPKEGLERDFVFYAFGYYKNRFYSTGGTVEPLPFSGMSTYPYPGSESYPYDAEHTAYINEYNTRYYAGSQPSPEAHHTIYTDYVKVEVTAKTPVGGSTLPLNYIELLAPFVLVVIASIVLGYGLVVRKRLKPHVGL